VPSAVENDIAINRMATNNHDGDDVKRGGGSRPSEGSMTTFEHSESENTSNANNDSAEKRGPPKEGLVANGKPTKNYEEVTNMVKSWREELHMMNVKSSILLDDLVKLGADV